MFIPVKQAKKGKVSYSIQAYLTNLDGDIIFSFSVASDIGELVNVIFGDFNEDGLTDIRTILILKVDDKENNLVTVGEKTFYQQNNVFSQDVCGYIACMLR